MATTKRAFRKDLWTLIHPYWKSEEKLTAWTLLIVIIVLTLGMVYLSVQFNTWYNDFYNSLQEKNQEAFFRLLGKWCILAALYIVTAVYAFYLNQMLQIRWRRWLTDKYLKDWLADRAYYRMQLTGKGVDNPDQRIAEDLKLLVDQTLDLSLGFLNAVVTLVSFTAILWALSGPITLPLTAAAGITIPGYMFWVAVIYAAAGTWLTHRIGKPLIALNFNQQRYEADFRYNLVRFRENSEGVALYRGEQDELDGFRVRFADVVKNWWQLMKRQKFLNFFTIGYNVAANVFPIAVAAPRYFSGAIQLGGLMQISNAFDKVQGSMSWFVNAYPLFASWKAAVDRLTSFHNAIVEARDEQRSQPGVDVGPEAGPNLDLQGVELGLPTGRPLLANTNLSVAPGDRVLLHGPSGSGKSTLFRAIAGIWPFGRGKVRTPQIFRALFLPQRPYFPLGSLRQVVSYPAAADAFSDEQVKEAITAVGLPQLCSRVDESANWSMQLSGGEQQRVAFARALLHAPQWLFLDEATSALEPASEAQMYRLLEERLPGTTIVSISHRPEVGRFHNSSFELKGAGNGGPSVLVASAG